jgi:hypothetical protein
MLRSLKTSYVDLKLFIWNTTAEDIIAEVQRGRATLHQVKPQTDH